VRDKDLTLTVTGTAVTVPTRLSVAPFVARGTAAAPDNLRAQLQVVNPGGQPLLAFLRYLPEPTVDPLPFAPGEVAVVPGGAPVSAMAVATAVRETIPPPSPYPQVRVWVPAGATLTWADAVAELFGGSDVDGAVEVELFAPTGAPLAAWTSPVRLYQSGNPAGGADLADLVDTAWSGAPRTITGIDDKLVDQTVLSLTDLAAYDISLVATLRDWSKAVVDTRLVGVLRGSTKTVTIAELFPTAGAAAGPLSLELALSGIHVMPFLADAAEIDARGDQVRLLPVEP
jgi:hypothetical protein